ncbi:hypothetical protein COBT_001888 [Conglomerata obtusa]
MTRDEYDQMVAYREEARKRSEATPLCHQPATESPNFSRNIDNDVITQRLKDKAFINYITKYINDKNSVNEVISFLPKLTIVSDIHSLNVVVSIIVTLLHIQKTKISSNYNKTNRDLIYRKIVEKYIRDIKNQMFEQFRESNYNGISIFAIDKEFIKPTIDMIVDFVDEIRLKIEPLRTVDDLNLTNIEDVLYIEIDFIKVMEICNEFENI